MDNTETKLTIKEVFAEFQCPYKVGVALKELLDDWKRKKKEVEKMTIFAKQSI